MRVVRFLLLGLVAAAAIGVSAFLSWIDDRSATEIPARELFEVTGDSAGFGASLGLAMLIAAVVALVATVLAARMLLLLASLAALAMLITWVLQMAVDAESAGFSVDDLQTGVWVALGGGLVGVLAVWLGRKPKPRRAPASTAA